MKIQDVFEVVINSDLTEGRGRAYVCARFLTKVKAVRYSKGRDVMGSDGKVQAGKVLVVTEDGTTSYFPINSAVPVYETVQDKARTEALNKLTPDERHLLGLT